jgi:hypothetical protein
MSHIYIRMKKMGRNCEVKQDKKNRGIQENNKKNKIMTAKGT